MKKEKKREVSPKGSSSDCFFVFVFVIEQSESAHKSPKSITTLCVF
jgi:hypothetical protein